MMLRSMKTYALLLSMIFLGLCMPVRAEAKTIKKNVTVLQGTTRKIPMDSTDVEQLKVSNKNISVTAKDFFVKVKAKKAGKTTITFKIKALNQSYKYTVTVLSAKKVEKAAHKKIKAYYSKLPKGTRYAYLDLNQDGVRELYHSGKIIYYDYKKNKCAVQKCGFKELYRSSKSKYILAVYQKPRKTTEFIYWSEYFVPSNEHIFRLDATGTGFREYTEEGKNVYGANAPYAYYDYGYDQDDYEYEALTKDQVIKKLSKKIPGYKKVVLKTKR